MSYSDIIKKKQKEWDCPDLMNSVKSIKGGRIPFTSPLMNWFTYGGIPRDGIIEFYGPEGSGKTTTAMDLAKNANTLFRNEYEAKLADLQEKFAAGNKHAQDDIDELREMGPKKVLYIDVENSFDVSWGETLGLVFSEEENTIDVMQPPTIVAEKLLQAVRELIETGELGMVIIDSVPALTPETMLKKDIGEKTVAALAGLMTNFMVVINPILKRHQCTMVLINQCRDNLVNPYVKNTPGGRALKFFSLLRLEFKKGSYVDFLGNELPNNVKDPAGCKIEATLIKQKTAPNDRRMASYFLMTQSGIRDDFDYAQLALNTYGLIRKVGGWYTLINPKTGEVLQTPEGKEVKVNGMANVYNYLATNTDYYNDLKEYVQADIEGENNA